MVVKNMDLITTIEDDQEVENLSEDSDAEVEVRKLRHLVFFLIKNINIFSFPFKVPTH